MGQTWDVLQRADALRQEKLERERTGRDAAEGDATAVRLAEGLAEDLASLRVSVHALEDRVELELRGLQDELRQAIAKSNDQSASRERAAQERLLDELGQTRDASRRIEKRVNWLMAFATVASALMLFRC